MLNILYQIDINVQELTLALIYNNVQNIPLKQQKKRHSNAFRDEITFTFKTKDLPRRRTPPGCRFNSFVHMSTYVSLFRSDSDLNAPQWKVLRMNMSIPSFANHQFALQPLTGTPLETIEDHNSEFTIHRLPPNRQIDDFMSNLLHS